MSDIFDFSTAKDRLEAAIGSTTGAREQTQAVLAESTANIREANTSFLDSLTKTEQAAEVAYDEADSILLRLQELEGNPDVVNNLLAIFDSDYDEEFQLRKLQRTEFNINRINAQQERLKTAHATTVAANIAETESAIRTYTMNRQDVLDQLSIAQTGLAFEEAFDKRQAALVGQATEADLRAWVKDPSSAPEELQGAMGLVNTEITARSLVKANLTGAQLQNTLQSSMVAENERIRALSSLSNEELGGILTLPDLLTTDYADTKLTLEDIQAESSRREKRSLALETAKLNIARGEFELLALNQTKYLNEHNSTELKALHKQAVEGGGEISIEGVPFTERMLRDAAAAATVSEVAQLATAAETATQDTKISIAQNEIATSLATMSAIVNPGGAGAELDALPITMRTKVESLLNEADALSKVGYTPGALERYQEVTALIAEAKEKALADIYSDDTIAGAREWSETRSIKNPENAVNLLAPALLNSGMMAADPVMDPLWRPLAAATAEILGRAATEIGVPSRTSEGKVSLNIFKLKNTKPAEVLQQAIANSNIVNRAGNVIMQAYIVDTIESAVAEQGDTSIWRGIVNERTGQFISDVYEPADVEGEPDRFSYNRLAAILAQKTGKLREQGVLQSDESLNAMLADMMQAGLPELVYNFGRDNVYKAAFHQAVFANRLDTAIGKMIAVEVRGRAPAAFAYVERAAVEAEEQRRRETPPIAYPPDATPIVRMQAPPTPDYGGVAELFRQLYEQQ